MKNAFALSSLILTAGYPAAVALSTFGVLPLPAPSLFEFFGIYTALGVIAFAFGDYSRAARALVGDRTPVAPHAALIPFVQEDPLHEQAPTLKAA
jgi:hypothetical protein